MAYSNTSSEDSGRGMRIVMASLLLRDIVGEANASNVIERWREPQRGFHTVKHLNSVLAAFEPEEKAFILAAFYHDAIYIPGCSGNEADSARLLEKHTGHVPRDETIEKALRLIRSTAILAHKTDPDEERFFLADCAVLKSPMDGLLEQWTRRIPPA